MLHDEKCAAALDRSANMLVPWYLMSSYAYYHLDSPVLSDGMFDSICRRLVVELRGLTHMHKHLVKRADILAGTCLLPLDAYPSMVKGAVAGLVQKQSPQRVRLASSVPAARVRLDKPERVRLARPQRVRLL